MLPLLLCKVDGRRKNELTFGVGTPQRVHKKIVIDWLDDYFQDWLKRKTSAKNLQTTNSLLFDNKGLLCGQQKEKKNVAKKIFFQQMKPQIFIVDCLTKIL